MPYRIRDLDEYRSEYGKSVEDPEGFWAAKAESFLWRKKWDRVLDWDFREPRISWYTGGRLNITENCLDRHLADRGDQPAIVWEPNNPDEKGRTLSYRELHAGVCRLANVLKQRGVVKGDRVCLYMPMIPELAMAVLACARIGAIHSVVFGGFSANALSGRISDSTCKVVITTDGAYRGNKTIPMKAIVDEAVSHCPCVEKVIVFHRTGEAVNMLDGRDVHGELAMEAASPVCEAASMDSEDTLFILYTSGSTGKPKGVVHTTGGYMVFAHYSFVNVFQYDEGDMYWCTADIGWITGHTYIVYGPLLAGASTLMFEGIPTWPDAGRFWQVVDKHRVSIFYTAPTAIRALEAAGTGFVEPYALDSLRVLGTVGEPINEEAWHWYNTHVGRGRCPIVDTWWQTETGGILISPLAGITPTRPSYATLPLPGVQPVLVDEGGRVLESDAAEGNLCIRFPWPSILRTTWGDHERCRKTYFSAYPGLYFTGDGCRRDKDGYYRITGRVDDVINVSGHRIGTAEVESAINIHPDIVESAVVGYPHAIKGQGIYAYVISTNPGADAEALRKEVLAVVTREIGPIAKPDRIQVVDGLPKTRSGKIMRRILRKIAEGEMTAFGDTSTLLDPAVVERIKEGALSLKAASDA